MILRTSFCERLASLVALVFFVGLQWNACAAGKDGGFVVYPGAQEGPVLFSHSAHGEDNAGFPCKQCHAADSQEGLQVTMEGIRKGRTCGSCHDGRTKGPRSRQVASPIQDCGRCHMPVADIVFNLNRMDPVRFSHVRHLSVDLSRKVSNPAGFSCGDCHPDPFDRAADASFWMETPHESGGCAQCHNGRKRNSGMPAAFAATTRCLTCHKP